MLKKIFGVAWRVGRSIIVTLLVSSMCFLSLVLCLFIVTTIVPVVLSIIAYIMLGVGVLIIIVGILICTYCDVRKGIDTYKILSASNNLTAKDAWEKTAF